MKIKKHFSDLKLFGFLSFSIVVTVSIIISISLKAFEKDFIKTTNTELAHITHGIQANMNAWGQTYQASTKIMAESQKLIEAVEKKNLESIQNQLSHLKKTFFSNAILVTDKDFNIISTTSPQVMVGTKFPLATLKSALLERPVLTYATLGTLPFSEFYASEIRNADGKIVGYLILTYDVTTDKFINLINEYGVDCTIFRGDVRQASTLRGVLGTKINNREIEKTVLKDGKMFIGQVEVRGTDFYAVYSPLKNADGTIAGMVFVAREIKIIKTVTNGILKAIIPICVITAIVVIIILSIQLMFERKKLKSRVKILDSKVNWDALTGANSRQFGIEELEHGYINFMRGLPSPAIMMLDVDNFKSVNDTYGHEAGDQVLKKIIDTIYVNCRTNDKIIRWGGDEFIGIFDGMKPEVIPNFAEKLLNSVQNTKFNFGGKETNVTVSLGFSYFSKKDKQSDDVLSRADLALYKSKENGKNSSCINL
ncbi:diguanylate cyclase [Treponema zioleckii]|uniref:diguanylate cyclase n=1 Tax=Treponema zioleckii TaxID=331680 RepID=UPI00168C06BA|nr:diguanylate cyclase [Treponema zioleckii]